MKKYILATSVVAMLLSFMPDNKPVYTIKGTWSGATDGEIIYLQQQDFKTKVITKYDSAVVKGGQFMLTGNLPVIDEYELATNYGKTTIVLSENPLTVEIAVNDMKMKKGVVKSAKFDLKGDVEQTYFKEFMRAKTIGMMGMMGVAMGLPKAQKEGNKALEDSLLGMYVTSMATEKRIIDSLTTNFNDSYTIAIILKKTTSKTESYDILLKKYNNLTDRIKQSSIGLELKDLVEKIGKAAVGQLAPDFKGQSPDGKEISLSSFKGKYVLIDFWASWCSPCLEEVPNVKSVYQDYKAKGLEIVSVSLDENKTKWINAISKYGLNWVHLSTLKGWECEIAKAYNVTGVPAMLLLDKEGRIISKDLRGEKLREEVQKAIDKK